ncbi:MAG: hypothetical protein JJU29_13145 [Verrucomicrobia bacterium]|nr:hypothetical protein [Verrucomicrobiota bacterium]
MKPDLQSLAQDSRYLPSVLGFFAVLILLLFVDKIPDNLSQWLLPALIVYSIGAGILSFIQAMLGVRSRDEEKIQKRLPDWIPEPAFWILIVAHILWFFVFICYISCRGVL